MKRSVLYAPVQHFQPYIRLTDGSLPPKGVEVSSSMKDGFLTVKVKNHSTRHLAVREVVLYETPIPFGDITPQTMFYGEGFQMLTQYTGTVENPRVIGSYGTDWDFFNFTRSAFNRDMWTVYNYITFMPEGKDALLLGFCSTNKYSGEFRFNRERFEVVMNTENIVLDRGEEWTMEELYAASGDREQLIQEMAERLNQNHPRMYWPEIPVGWCSYYCLRPMTADGLVENAEAMARRIPELKMIQIDAGYNDPQKGWLAPNPKMGGDMKSTCERIRAHGIEAGGYLSPFMHSANRHIPLEHPDWLIQDEDGFPTHKVGRKEYLILDGTNPEARDYLVSVVKHFHDEWGIRYFKLDFIAYGAFQSGVRYNRKQTGIEAYRLTMKAICDAVGGDSFILACNAPMWPAIGLCHGNRVTNDIHRDWKHIHKNAEELFWRNWMNDTLWFNDPDVIELEKQDLQSRGPDGEIIIKSSDMTDDEIEFHKAFAAACGGMMLSGDLIDGLSEKNLKVMKKLLPPSGVAAKFDDYTFKVGRTEKDGKLMLELFNWGEENQSLDVPLNGRYQVQDFWTDEPIGEFEGSVPVKDMPPHSGRVLLCTPV